MFDELKFPDISHLTRLYEKYSSVMATNFDHLSQLSNSFDELIIKGALDLALTLAQEHILNTNFSQYRSMANDVAKLVLGIGFAIGREYAETYPEKAQSCIAIKNISSILLLDATKKELYDLSQYAATPIARLYWLMKQHSLISENETLEMIDTNLDMCQGFILWAFQGGIISFYAEQRTHNPSTPISQYMPQIPDNNIKHVLSPLDLLNLGSVAENSFDVTPDLRGIILETTDELANIHLISLLIKLQKLMRLTEEEIRKELEKIHALICTLAFLSFFIGVENGLSNLNGFSSAHYIDKASQILENYMESLVAPLKVGGILKGNEAEDLVPNFLNVARKNWKAAQILGNKYSSDLYQKNDLFLNALSSLE